MTFSDSRREHCQWERQALSVASFLFGQLEQAMGIQQDRRASWKAYNGVMRSFGNRGLQHNVGSERVKIGNQFEVLQSAIAGILVLSMERPTANVSDDTFVPSVGPRPPDEDPKSLGFLLPRSFGPAKITLQWHSIAVTAVT